MKESAGEANMTVITIVLIGLVAAAGAVLIPSLLNSTSKKNCCNAYGGIWDGPNNVCKRVKADGTSHTISDTHYWDSSKNKCTPEAGG